MWKIMINLPFHHHSSFSFFKITFRQHHRCIKVSGVTQQRPLASLPFCTVQYFSPCWASFSHKQNKSDTCLLLQRWNFDTKFFLFVFFSFSHHSAYSVRHYWDEIEVMKWVFSWVNVYVNAVFVCPKNRLIVRGGKRAKKTHADTHSKHRADLV